MNEKNLAINLTVHFFFHYFALNLLSEKDLLVGWKIGNNHAISYQHRREHWHMLLSTNVALNWTVLIYLWLHVKFPLIFLWSWNIMFTLHALPNYYHIFLFTHFILTFFLFYLIFCHFSINLLYNSPCLVTCLQTHIHWLNAQRAAIFLPSLIATRAMLQFCDVTVIIYCIVREKT